MTRSTSIYLDLLRFSAAMIVFLQHLSYRQLSGGFLWQFQGYGHGAVVVFFVLSGFVIAYTVATRDRAAGEYALNRLARLYSVVLPALILTFVLDRIGSRLDPAAYLMDRETMPAIRLLAAASFTSQSGWWSIDLFSNGPYWSLPYEFWYYVLFGCLIYFKGSKRAILFAGAAVIAGPKILMMAPIWAFGATAYHLSRRISLSREIAWLLFCASGIVAFMVWYRPLSAGTGLWPLDFSTADYLLGLAVAVNFFAATCLEFPFGRTARPIKWAAGFTFSLYLYHLPLLHFAAAVTPAGLPTALHGAGMMVFALLGVWLLGSQTERKKHVLRRWMAGAFVGLAKIRAA